ncbi:hypothetical protein GMOD_00006968 [Pyrenophora seminiperda CCB06]|uniref:Uncharacterized protein n=1 Tax=Pyrenophora seminiperda CCB06 TaxID=1302712 RepID=A0A3M7MBZ3_9PLEO|nr:hypothetical protein GMOD_00006968 [Pyrenophora seminiperda CCB06]
MAYNHEKNHASLVTIARCSFRNTDSLSKTTASQRCYDSVEELCIYATVSIVEKHTSYGGVDEFSITQLRQEQSFYHAKPLSFPWRDESKLPIMHRPTVALAKFHGELT